MLTWLMLKLTGGEWRGRSIDAPSGLTTRPTQAQLRQAWMNSIQFRISEARVLDLFAGSGALGFEALSRGAASAVFVESDRKVLQLIERNAQKLGCEDRIEARAEALERFRPQGAFNLIFADPPYTGNFELRILDLFAGGEFLAPEALVMIEWGRQKSIPKELPQKSGVLVKIREKEYGDSILSTYQKL